MPQQIDDRTRLLNDKPVNADGKYVLYFMMTARRAHYNHALEKAIAFANERNLPVVVFESLVHFIPWASDRIHTFILEGVPETRARLQKRGIRYLFYLQQTKAQKAEMIEDLWGDAAALFTDDFPCYIIPHLNARLAKDAPVPVYAVDGNGMIPMSRFEKEEYAAYTIRPKVHKLLPEYDGDFVEQKVKVKSVGMELPVPETIFEAADIPKLVAGCAIDHAVKPSPIYHGGYKDAKRRLNEFLKNDLARYDTARNEPALDATSRMSNSLHFGFISAHEIYEAVKDADVPAPAKKSYLEELVVRRELGYNMCRYNPHFESLEALPDWAKKNIEAHDGDKRPVLFSREQIEYGETDDALWNAAQIESIETGEIHNYMRMLWGKKFIEWLPSYQESFDLLHHLNNKYSLDGRNPNSYAGILWTFGKHDRAWGPKRPVFGTIRYMSSASMVKKIDAKGYTAWVNSFNPQRQAGPLKAVRYGKE